MEVEPTGLWVHPVSLNPNLRAIQSGTSKLYLGPAACWSLNLSFKYTQEHPSPVIQFFLYLVFTVPYRHSGQANVSFRVPSAGWRKLNRGSCSSSVELRELGEEYSAAAKQQILQLRHGLSQEISRMQIFL